MARQRLIKPEVRTSVTVASWKREVRLAWIYLWMSLDNYGRARDDLLLLKAELFPRDRDVTEARLDGWLTLMATTKTDDEDDPPLCRYEVRGQRYLHAVKWTDHQKLSHLGEPRCPPCPVHESLANDSGTATKRVRKASGKVPKDVETRPHEVEVEVEEEVEEKKKTLAVTPAATTARKRDELFDALIEELNVDPAELTTAARGSLNNALKQLREVGATPLQIHSRCRRFRRRYADARLTPAALAKHWPDLATEGPPGSAQASPHPAGWEFGMGGVPWTPKVAD